MSKTWRGLGRSLVRRLYCRPSVVLSALTFPQAIIASAPKGATPVPLRQTKAAFATLSFFFLFPLFSYSYTLDEIKDRVRGAYLYSYSSNGSLVSSIYYGHYDDVVSAFRSNWLAVETNGHSLGTPDIDDIAYNSTNAFTSANVTRPVFDIADRYYRVSSFSEIVIIYKFAQSLYLSGYRGSGISDIAPSSSNYSRFNFNYIVACSDILASTNSVYRQILLSHLNSIQQSVANIEVNMSGVQSAVEEGNASLSNLNVVASDIRDAVYTNLVSVSNVSESVSAISSNSVDILRGVDLLHDDWLASSIDVFLGDDTEAWVNFLNIAVEQGLLSESDASQYASTLRDTDPTRLKGASKAYAIPASHRRFFAKNSIKGTVVEAQQMRGRYQTFRNWTNQRGEMFGAMDATWNAVAGDRINSIMGAHVDDWRQELRQQLQDWKTSDERGILNVKKSIEDNFSTTDPRAPASSNSIPFTAFQTNFVTRPLTNAVREAAHQIQSNATANADRQIEADDNRWEEFKDIATGQGDGINVRIVNPLWEQGGFHVNVRDDAVVSAIQNLSAAPPPELVHISDAWDSFMAGGLTNSIDWTPWFERWDPYSGMVTNFYAEYNATVPSVDIASDFVNNGFDSSRYDSLPWFQRVEVLLAMIAGAGSNSVEVADIDDDMEDQVTAFQNLSTNVVSASSDVVGLFDYVKRFSSSLQSVFGDRAAPLTGDYVLLPAGDWIGDEPLTLRINPNIQNLCRLIMQCIWYLGLLVLLWVVVSWVWSKVVAVLRWLWSMFDV